jgi:SNF2 family DNA or RNA helicase
MERDFFTDMAAGRVTAPTSAVKSNKLLQLANGAIYHEDQKWSWTHDEKIEAAKSVVEEAGGAPVLIAYQFQSDLQRLQEAFPKARTLKDKQAEYDWNAGRIPVLLAHPKSAGHGLNLQHGGNILVYFGQDWNLEDNLQILERIGPTRQMQSGYDRPVFVYNILARNTMDSVVRQRRDHKLTVMDSLMQAMKDLTSGKQQVYLQR